MYGSAVCRLGLAVAFALGIVLAYVAHVKETSTFPSMNKMQASAPGTLSLDTNTSEITSDVTAKKIPVQNVFNTEKNTSVLLQIRETQSDREDSRCLRPTAEITVVTAFFYLGESFPKGHKRRESSLYYTWMQGFKFVSNPVIAYFGRQEDADYFAQIRSSFPPNMTRTVTVDRSRMWAFQLAEQLKEFINESSSNNPQRKYESMVYSCVQHAKYELMLGVTKENPFCTKYVMWLDIGFFRDIAQKTNYTQFHLKPPPQFNESCVAYSSVGDRLTDSNPIDILHGIGRWISGAAALATMDVMTVWTQDYIKYLTRISNEYMFLSTDQGIIHSLSVSGMSSISVQAFSGKVGEGDRFRTLGYLCKDAQTKVNSSIN